MDQMELNKLCAQPGTEGSLWRLIRRWDPDQLAGWIADEKKRGATPEVLIHCVAEAMSGAAFVLANAIGGDRRGAMLGDQGLLGQFRAQVAHKIDAVGQGYNIIMPNKLGH